MRAGKRGACRSRGGASSAQGVPITKAEGRARAESTLNMDDISVTLDVSKLSGWLNTDAPCRVGKRKHRRRGDMRAKRREGVGWSRPDCGG